MPKLEISSLGSLVLKPGRFQVWAQLVQELKKRLENAFQKANDFCVKEAVQPKQRFDRTAKGSKLLPGNLIFVKKKVFALKHKIADKVETEPCEIVSQRSYGLPVYTVIRNDRVTRSVSLY